MFAVNLKELAEQTPASRDRYVDFLRAASITVVVLGHWLSTLAVWKDGTLSARNAVGVVPGLCYSTWLLQVMPVFFFIGGFSNFRSLEGTLRRGETAPRFVKARLARLLKPTGVFILVWLVILLGLHLAGALTPGYFDTVRFLVAPLWFLLVYLLITALTPVTYGLHRRYRISALVVLGSAAAGIELVRFLLSMPDARWANVIFVWMFAHQLGYFYADGTLARARQRAHAAMALAGLVALLVLTHSGLFPKSMIGTGFERDSNMFPPTVCLVALTFWLVGAAMYMRRVANRWLARSRAWQVVVAANSVIMTAFLWHMPAYAAAFALLNVVGFSDSAAGTARWWLERPIWLVAPGLVLALLIVMFSRFERPTLRPRVTAD